MTSSSHASSLGSRWFLGALGGIIAMIGLLFTALLWRSFERAREMRHWPTVPAMILTSYIAERHEFGDTHPSEFRFEVSYGYSWHQQSLTSDLFSLRGAPWSTDRSTAENLLDRYPPGKTVTALVNPANPEIAVLEADSLAPGYSLWFPAMFAIGGVGVCYRAIRPRGKLSHG